MYKISLMGLNDLEEAYKIELDVNPSPWKYETFISSFEVGHKGLICKQDNQIIGFFLPPTLHSKKHAGNKHSFVNKPCLMSKM